MVKNVLLDAGMSIYLNRVSLLKRLLFPFGLLVLSYTVPLAQLLLFEKVVFTYGYEPHVFVLWTGAIFFSILPLVGFLMAWPLAAIIVHRVMLLGVESVKEYSIFWTRRETWFLMHFLGFVLILSPLYLLTYIPEVGDFVAWLAIAYVGSRLSLVFPGIAVDRGVSFRLSWQLTSGYKLPAFMVVGIIPLILGLPGALLEGFWYLIPLSVLVELIVILYLVATLSGLYGQIVNLEYGVTLSEVGGATETDAST